MIHADTHMDWIESSDTEEWDLVLTYKTLQITWRITT